VPAPPLDDTSWHAVYRWLTEVERGLVSRREQRTIANAVHRALSAESKSRRHIESLRRSMARADTREADQDAGIYWQIREGRRVSQRPVRVEVAPYAWEAFKHQAERAGTTVGERLGRLAADAARREFPDSPTNNERARRLLFVRIAINNDDWIEVRHRTRCAGRTIARYLGAIIEQDAT
jgi:hypothetical protein